MVQEARARTIPHLKVGSGIEANPSPTCQPELTACHQDESRAHDELLFSIYRPGTGRGGGSGILSECSVHAIPASRPNALATLTHGIPSASSHHATGRHRPCILPGQR